MLLGDLSRSNCVAGHLLCGASVPDTASKLPSLGLPCANSIPIDYW